MREEGGREAEGKGEQQRIIVLVLILGKFFGLSVCCFNTLLLRYCEVVRFLYINVSVCVFCLVLGFGFWGF